MKQKIKVVWLCHFSNAEVREYLPVKVPTLEKLVRTLMHNPSKENTDFAQWNTNGIKEFEKFSDEVDLYVVAPYHYLTKEEVRFNKNGIHYYFYKDKPSYLLREFCKRILKKHKFKYSWNRKMALKEIKRIQPNIVHLIGAENPNYGLAALDLSKKIPLIVQLQTMLSDPKFEENYFMRKGDYIFRQSVEERLILRGDYIGTTAIPFIPFVKQIKDDSKVLSIGLAIAEQTKTHNDKTLFDFVYFASSIDKAADLAVEAFAIAHKKHPDITLDIVGRGSPAFTSNLRYRVGELGLSDAIFFEGHLPTHEDVIMQIRKSRFALLPLKIDLISGTIREAMANGLPVVTTVSPSTPLLNENRESVLLSESGNHAALAANMCVLIENEEIARQMSDNVLITASEQRNNVEYMKEWKDSYFRIINERE